jgi:hypothetical protein
MRTLPINFDLLGGKRKYIEMETTGKLQGKQTSIAAVREQFLSFATFLNPLLSRYRLPLRQNSTSWAFMTETIIFVWLESKVGRG